MAYEKLEGIVSSRVRLKIADLLSIRPRTLKELADITGISVQAVLKHLEKLDSLGVLDERRIDAAELAVRKVYYITGVHVGDFSLGDLTIVKLSRTEQPPARGRKAGRQELERLAEDSLVQRRRIREQARRLGRMIDDLVATEGRLNGLIESLRMKDGERLMVHTFFTEESMEEAESSLKEHYGVTDARRAIERALGKVGSVDK
jgi:predicted transcriptional regulator